MALPWSSFRPSLQDNFTDLTRILYDGGYIMLCNLTIWKYNTLLAVCRRNRYLSTIFFIPSGFNGVHINVICVMYMRKTFRTLFEQWVLNSVWYFKFYRANVKKHSFNNVCISVCTSIIDVCVYFFFKTLSETVKVLQKVFIEFKMDTEGKLNFKGVILANKNKVFLWEIEKYYVINTAVGFLGKCLAV